ncbi:predicted protein [Aspergillus nidulans FGSC A4]|uniref:Uncharacterized protein n=1 Tax=Emericella nidulans (strain FGSC A4 / ATCC 38163 / CBS 112.46 / NRRL 194 / M139) TaxID=227321 RepID=Q5B4T2_EMENI|nr:hypothetical protein [Aspergillus nidulans FGSC A4]EAA60213.1 predicted protein [Aspergillus nidulans FGSC A4]CBF77498.1 TPA: conserved hypothetical protein [Aspergillus nidulans FGSC A4]|eukprot:XP_662052.1 predicted protein [Aspergillus nidulans FGSC A4]
MARLVNFPKEFTGFLLEVFGMSHTRNARSKSSMTVDRERLVIYQSALGFLHVYEAGNRRTFEACTYYSWSVLAEVNVGSDYIRLSPANIGVSIYDRETHL